MSQKPKPTDEEMQAWQSISQRRARWGWGYPVAALASACLVAHLGFKFAPDSVMVSNVENKEKRVQPHLKELEFWQSASRNEGLALDITYVTEGRKIVPRDFASRIEDQQEAIAEIKDDPDQVPAGWYEFVVQGLMLAAATGACIPVKLKRNRMLAEYDAAGKAICEKYGISDEKLNNYKHKYAYHGTLAKKAELA